MADSRPIYACFAACAAIVAFSAVPASAQSGSDDEDRPRADAEQRQTSFSLEDVGLDAQVGLRRGNPEDGEPRWQVEVRKPEQPEQPEQQAPLSTIPAPRWVGDAHYAFSVATDDLDDTHTAVLFTASPGASSKAPPSAPEFKAAWIVDTDSNADGRWRHVASTQYSELDGGSRLALRERGAAPELVRFRPDAADRFCGVLPDDTFAYERYVVSKTQFETEFDFDALAQTSTLISTRLGDPEFTPPMLQGWLQWFIASSDARTPDEDESLMRPLELGDFRLEMGWSEGVEGLGRGEFVTAQVNDSVPMTSLRIFPGDGASEERYRVSGKPTRLLVALGNGTRYVFDLPAADYDTMVEHHGIAVELPEPQRTSCMSMVILDAERGVPISGTRGAAAEAVTMAEVTPYSTIHGASPEQTARNLVDFVAASDNTRRRERVSELGLTIGKPLVTAVLDKMREGTPEERRRVIPLLASIPSDEAVPLLADYLEHFGPGDQEYRAVKRALAAHHRNSADALVTYIESMEDVTSRKYVDMIRLLGRVGAPEDIAILLDDLGQGDEQVRNERVRAIAKAGTDLVADLVDAAAREPNSAQSHDAFKALNLIGRRTHYDSHGVLPKPDVYLETLQKTQKRRTLMRALRVAKYFRADGFVELVRDKYVDYPDPLVQREAIAALGRYSGEPARVLIVGAMKDRSPDVRIAAVETLGQRADAAKAVDELRTYVDEERWKAGLQEAFQTLAGIDTERTDAIFEALLVDRPSADATLISLQALNRAHRSLDGRKVVNALEERASRAQLKLELVDNLGFDDSAAGSKWLIAAATRGPTGSQAADEKAARDVRRVRRHAIMALGRRRGTDGRKALFELARTTDNDDVQEVAIRALGFYASPELLEALREWRRTAEPALHEKLDDTIDMVDRRISIDEAEDELIDAMEDDPNDAEGETPPKKSP